MTGVEPDHEEGRETQEAPAKRTKVWSNMRPPPPPEPTSAPSTVNISSDTPAPQSTGVLELASSSPPVVGSSRKLIPVGSSDPPEAVVGATAKTPKAKGPRGVVTINISVLSHRSERLNANHE
ncbi:hypothetical protein RhiJN_22792 [Ceratobasidium sp. AG-Ba]|nr:hypothetical protein RhiJN_22792 [Ceratobasidium sp. AG-Ba]